MPQITDEGFYKEKCYICGEWKQAFQRIGNRAATPEDAGRGVNAANEREMSGIFPTIEYFCVNPDCPSHKDENLISKEWKKLESNVQLD
jgi:hypothetical protein